MITFVLSSLVLLAAIALLDRRATDALRRLRRVEVLSQQQQRGIRRRRDGKR